MAKFADLTVIPAAANVTIVAVDLSNVDKRLRLGGNSGIPYNDGNGRLIGTSLVFGTTPQSGFAGLTGNSFTGAQIATVSGEAVGVRSGDAGSFAGFGIGRVGAEGSLAISAANNNFVSGDVAGDIVLYVSSASKALHLASGVSGGAAGLKVLGPDAFAQGDFKISTVGKGLYVKEGANATMGTLTLNGTTGVVVNTTKVTANSRILMTHNVTGGTPGFCYVDSRVAGTSFTVKGTAGDTSTVAWMIVEPA